jgi:hypothetical protein
LFVTVCIARHEGAHTQANETTHEAAWRKRSVLSSLTRESDTEVTCCCWWFVSHRALRVELISLTVLPLQASSRTADQEMHPLWNAQFQCRVHKSLPLGCILSQTHRLSHFLNILMPFRYSGRIITESLGNVIVRGEKDGKSKRGARWPTV